MGVEDAAVKVIYKYEMPCAEKFELQLPKFAQIIRVDSTDEKGKPGKFWLWAIVDTEAELETRYFECYKTGMSFTTDQSKLSYIGFCTLYIMQELCLYIFER